MICTASLLSLPIVLEIATVCINIMLFRAIDTQRARLCTVTIWDILRVSRRADDGVDGLISGRLCTRVRRSLAYWWVDSMTIYCVVAEHVGC